MSDSGDDEIILVLHAQHGDRSAFSNLVNLYDRRLLYFVRRLLGESDEAYDVVQTVWLHVHRKIRRLVEPRAFRVWLFRIAHCQTMTVLRRRTGMHDLGDHAEDICVTSESRDNEVFDNVELVHSALQFLSVAHRRVLVLRFLEDMTLEEIAEVLECSPGTVKSRLYHAREALRNRIREMEHD